MKTMTCKQLGGACDKEFHASTFEDLMEMSRQHGIAMFQQGDEDHLKAMRQMKDLMRSPEAMKAWMEEKRREFEELPVDVIYRS